MSVYKVPQDVEADDKLLGPFSPRQFVYLLITAGLVGLAWFLFTIYPGLIIIPLPFILFFGALALPIRKDQPMEAYFAAIISFNLKPNKRLWQPDGKEHLIEIAAPKNPERDRTKGIRQEEAVRRLSYLADIVDTEGWAIKNAVSAQHGQSANPIDVSEDPILNRNIDNLLARAENSRKAEIMQNMNTARNLADYSGLNAGQITERTYAVNPMNLYAGRERQIQQLETPDVLPQQLQYNPYPEGVKQSVISPIGQNNSSPEASFPQFFPQNYPQVSPPISPAERVKQEIHQQNIEKLVEDGKDLSVETLAKQAEKIQQKEEKLGEEEVIISLR